MTEAERQQAAIRELARRELARREAARQASGGAGTATAPPQPKMGAFGNAARVMMNDIEAGFQGVNPVSVAKHASSTMPLGPIRRDETGAVYVDLDGERVPLSRFPADEVVRHRADDGGLYLYRKTPEMDESPLASAGRVLGYGVPTTHVPAIKAADEGATLAQDAARVGVTPSLGMVGPKSARVASSMEAFFPTSGPVTKDSARAAGELARAAGEIAGQAGTASTKLEAGQALIEGANYFRTNTERMVGGLYRRVDSLIPAKTVVTTNKTQDVLREVGEVFAGKPEMARGAGFQETSKLLQELTETTTTWEQLSKWRSRLMDIARSGQGDPLVTIPEATRNRLIGAITDDMFLAARKAGPEAEGAWRRAAEAAKFRAGVIRGALDKIFKADAPEKAFADVFALTGETGRANLRDLAKIKATIRPEDWGQVVSAIVRRMGQATPGAQNATGDAFSASTFISNWSRIPDNTKDVLFQGRGLPDGLRADLDALARVVETAKEAGVQINRSRSAATGANLAAGTAAVVDPFSTAVTAVIANLGARAMTNRHVIRGLIVLGEKGDPSRLLKLSKSDAAVASEVATALRLATATRSE